jgi:ribosome biogenesis protein UTP30
MDAGAEKVSPKKVKEAVTALVEFVQKKNAAEQRLFDANTESVQLQFNLRDIPAKPKHKPTLIELPTPLYEGRSVCIVVKDPQRTYKDLFLKHPPHPQYRVVGVGKLKTKFRRFEDRRELCDAHDLFLCDTKVADMMPQVLGKYFFQTKKKLPIPVKVAPKDDDPAAPLVEAIRSTTLRTPPGPTCSVKIGRCDMDVPALLANAKKVLPVVFKHFAAEGNVITQVLLQATDAPALPVWRAAVPEAEKKASPKKRPASEAVEESPKKKAAKPSVAELAKEHKRRKLTKK